ncbi:hypothetical protein BH18ACI5_BH18ACI5_04370 [soil metagenome]
MVETKSHAPGMYVLRVPDVLLRVRLSRATLHRLRRAGQFPAAVRLTDRTVGFIASEVDGWIRERQVG